jgi:hypothetical protein
MDKRAIFELWAPQDSPWSLWAKPTLFVHLVSETEPPGELSLGKVPALPSAADRCALVLDLPGAESVALGLALARQGYRPVPLFNACPPPIIGGKFVQTTVEIYPILRAVASGGSILVQAELGFSAPPVFLLDVNRTDQASPLGPGTFDNRSVVFASDFPSAAFLHQRQITRAIVIHSAGRPVANDLRAALRHWKAAGLALDVITPEGEPVPVAWPGNGFFGELAVRWFAFFKLKRSSQGGFGAFVPESSGG